MKAIKIALLYWLQQALRLFCPHPTIPASGRDYLALVCPVCAAKLRIRIHLDMLCGMQAIYRLRKCGICHETLPDQESTVHSDCADGEAYFAAQEAESNLPV